MSWLFSDPTAELQKSLFNLKFSSKQMDKLSKKCEKEMEANKIKVKQAIQKGNHEGGRIYAENAIRKRNEANNFLRMSARLDAVSQRIQTALTMKQVTKDMGGLVRNLDKVMASMDLEKISKVMDKFEEQFADLDVRSSVMENSMAAATTLQTPEDQVDALIQKVADEHGLEIQQQLDSAKVGASGLTAAQAASQAEEDQLSHRLAQLRAQHAS
ncbi:chromatin modifying protein 1b [Capsaspora owczarzaki ATCC 30864]|uniref:Chromatin modifying protein 1b n=1 Tax=Capsaspora owczarzaki (strain ATCC 30864) TaxID=595528 RepID=A0A0D2W038_CAPO3|nr:chromatin modifying protein 1b [Capsaspora owczarzaki ATCC 30864]KJE97517.1 chromatin modifying protein 1b [Capsaspora owczarzaki ATCC 30864]|eukprot:XP_004343220.1 chromatin modifying protein 1b [Capsaspora owczarzaki ATCC 30864]